jgi:hypothetical protein
MLHCVDGTLSQPFLKLKSITTREQKLRRMTTEEQSRQIYLTGSGELCCIYAANTE